MEPHQYQSGPLIGIMKQFMRLSLLWFGQTGSERVGGSTNFYYSMQQAINKMSVVKCSDFNSSDLQIKSSSVNKTSTRLYPQINNKHSVIQGKWKPHLDLVAFGWLSKPLWTKTIEITMASFQKELPLSVTFTHVLKSREQSVSDLNSLRDVLYTDYLHYSSSNCGEINNQWKMYSM